MNLSTSERGLDPFAALHTAVVTELMPTHTTHLNHVRGALAAQTTEVALGISHEHASPTKEAHTCASRSNQTP